MKNDRDAQEWLRRALSNLVRAQAGKVADEVLYEDLCFDLQQSVEKSLKAVCIAHDIRFPTTHDIGYLLDLLDSHGIGFHPEVAEAKMLTEYAVTARYPGSYEPVEENEYTSALLIAERVFKWAQTIIVNGD